MKPSQTICPFSLRSALAFATLCGASQATAQNETTAQGAEQKKKTGETELPQITVTGNRERAYNPENLSSRKLTTPLLDAPQTFAVVPKEVFQQQSAQTLTDVLRNVPGISYQAGENGFSTGMGNFSMRGNDSSGSVFIDGVRDSGSYLRDVFNTEKVEVAKGPAGDNGRGTAGGYVNIVTKTPHLGNSYSGSSSFSFDEYGADGNFRNTLDVNQTLANSPFEGTAVRLNALFQDGGVPGRREVEANSWGIAPSLAIGLGTPTRFTFTYQHLEQNDIPDWGIPTGYPNSGAPVANGDAGFLSPGSRDRRDVFYGLRSDYDDIQSDTASFIFEHDFASGLKLSNQFRWARTEQDSRYTVPRSLDYPTRGGLTATATEGYKRENESFSNQINLSYEFATGALKHSLSTGLELSRETSDADKLNARSLGNVPTHNPDPNRAPGLPLDKLGYNDVTVETIGVYLYDTVEINRQWKVTGGVRVEHFDADIKRVVTNASGVVTSDESFTSDDTTVSGNIGVVYKPQENGSIYASAGIASLPPGSFLSNPDISRTGTSNDLPNYKEDAKSQESFNLELGTKWEFFDNRLSTSAALFYTEKRNITVDTPGNTSVPAEDRWEYTDQELYGLELGVAGKVSDRWSIYGGLLLMDSKRKNNSNVDNFRQASDGGAVNGDELAYTPNISASLWTTYDVTDRWTIGGGIQYVGSSYIGRPDDAARVIPNDQYGKYGELPDYVVFNALTSYKINENITIRLNVDNVFDELYAVSTNWAGNRSLLGAPRTYTISADWKF
ncbi:MAG: TonB-dependent siderophore receptor [Luteolibacter sp.]